MSATKIPAKSIHIPFMEGKTGWSNKTFHGADCWEQFQQYMYEISGYIDTDNVINKRKWLGCYKTDFEVTFEDGHLYKGCYGLQQNGLDDNDTLSQHIINFCLVYSGQKRPTHFKDGDWAHFIQNNIQPELGAFINKYDIPN